MNHIVITKTSKGFQAETKDNNLIETRYKTDSMESLQGFIAGACTNMEETE